VVISGFKYQSESFFLCCIINQRFVLFFKYLGFRFEIPAPFLPSRVILDTLFADQGTKEKETRYREVSVGGCWCGPGLKS
jgi:hypothetical protein